VPPGCLRGWGWAGNRRPSGYRRNAGCRIKIRRLYRSEQANVCSILTTIDTIVAFLPDANEIVVHREQGHGMGVVLDLLA